MKKVLCALLALASLSLAACASAGGKAAPTSAARSGLNDDTGSGPYLGVGATPLIPRPTFTLTDTADKKYDFGTQTAGKVTMLYFGYTSCPDICPATMADIGGALRALPKDVADQVTVVFVTTDVKTDKPAIIKQWLGNFTANTHATFVGLTGTQAQIDAAQASAHITLAEDDGKTHSTQVLLFSKDDYSHVSFIYNNNNEREQMQHDLNYVVTGQNTQ